MEEQSNKKMRALPSKDEAIRALGTFDPLERLVFFVAVSIATIMMLFLVNSINRHFMVAIPAEGGTLREGVVGTPRFVNPLLAANDADRDLTALVYRGLMKQDLTGKLIPDLAESYEVSEDGTTYTFTLREATFHDGTRITPDDVLFTIASAQDQSIKSVHRVEWEGVTASSPDESTVVLRLKKAYAPFLESTTLGILPKHVWTNVSAENWTYSDFNTKSAVGSGWYEIDGIATSSSGIPDYYRLSLYPKNSKEDAPLIENIEIHFYANEAALVSAYKKGEIAALSGIEPQTAALLAEDGAHIQEAPLPRVFGLFFNQNQAKIFAEASVRKAVAAAINKDEIVETVLHGYGHSIDGPVPEENTGFQMSSSNHAENASIILEKAGWKLGDDGVYFKTINKSTERLSFEIATSDVPELRDAVDMIVVDLAEAGIEAVPKVYESGSLSQDIIRPRKFQALFFGQVVAHQSSLFAFWHSSQRTDPGLNITGYTNSRADNVLEQALSAMDEESQDKLYAQFEKEIDTDVPAVFIYSPSFIYATRNLSGVSLGTITSPEDRFNAIADWYLDTQEVWKIFARNQKN